MKLDFKLVYWYIIILLIQFFAYLNKNKATLIVKVLMNC